GRAGARRSGRRARAGARRVRRGRGLRARERLALTLLRDGDGVRGSVRLPRTDRGAALEDVAVAVERDALACRADAVRGLERDRGALAAGRAVELRIARGAAISAAAAPSAAASAVGAAAL